MEILDSWQTLYDGTEYYNYKNTSIVDLSDIETFYTSTQQNDTDDINSLFSVTQTLSFIFYSITFVLGIPGNGLVIWIAGFKMKTVSAVWFLHLAIADFICCVSLPLRIADWALFTVGELANNLCKVGIGILYINMCASINFLTVMSIDRCVSVMWPFWSKTHRTPKCVRTISVIIWVLSLTLSVPHVILNNAYDDISECNNKTLSFYRFSFRNSMQLTRLVTMFVIPFTIILTCYGIIFFKLRKVKRSNRSQRPYRIITAVVTCFFICWFPYYTWPLIELDYALWHLDEIINTIFVCLAYSNSCINPILYVFIGQDFKKSFMQSIPSRLENALNERFNQSCGVRENYTEPISITGV